jgi:2-iminobutanoate/2-iminopropanoate deaminase
VDVEVLQPPEVARPKAPYSTVVKSDGLVFTAGQVPFDLEGELVAGGFDEQAHQVFRNLGSCLAVAGCTFSDVLKVTAYLADFADFSRYNEIYAEYFQPPYPVRTTVQAGLLGFKLELDAIARQ